MVAAHIIMCIQSKLEGIVCICMGEGFKAFCQDAAWSALGILVASGAAIVHACLRANFESDSASGRSQPIMIQNKDARRTPL